MAFERFARLGDRLFDRLRNRRSLEWVLGGPEDLAAYIELTPRRVQ